MEFLDLCIVVFYLVVTLVVGLWQSRRVDSMRDYAIADRNYATPVMVATISATWIGGGSTIGLVEKVAVIGFSYLVLFLGEPINKLIIARLLAPRMENFRGSISVGDVMERCYGKSAKIIAGISGSLLSAGLLGAQISALGFLFHFFFDLSHSWGVIIGFGVVVCYSTFGGIRAVTLTDVIQFGVLIVAIPMICNVGLNMVGGYDALFEKAPDDLLKIFPDDNSAIISNILLFCIISLPWLLPSAIQRLLMSRDAAQIRRSFTIAALLDVPLHLTIGIIAMVTLVLIPDVEPSLAMPSLINHILPVGLKGIAMVGMVAVIMSTCDSYLNAASICFVHDTVKPFFPSMESKTELFFTKVSTFGLGTLSVVIAVKYKAVMDIVFGSLNVWGPVIVVPLYAGLLGCKTSPASFLFGAGAGLITISAWMIFDLEKIVGFEGTLPSMIVNGAVFFMNHYFHKKSLNESVMQEIDSKKKVLG